MNINELKKRYAHITGGTQTLFPKQVDELFNDIEKYFISKEDSSRLEPPVMQKALEEFIEIMDWRVEEVPFEMADKTYNSSYGGGDCSKHGRYYGICHSCKAEQDRHYENQHREFKWQRDNKLEDLYRRIRKMLST